MTPTISSHPWSSDTLFAKALLYAQRMEAHTPDDGQFAFWSALALEPLARAALAQISPVLLADSANWRNVTYALGSEPTAKKFSPTSITTKEVIARLNELVPAFTQEAAGFCVKHIDKRNAELHTVELPFQSLGTSEWLPRFYHACAVLLASMNKTLSDFVADQKAAEEMIRSLEDDAAKAVNQDIKAHAQVWANKTQDERDAATLAATASTTRQAGHRVKCPSCGSPALVQGSPVGTVATEVCDDEVVQRQTMMPASFACLACDLRVVGLSRLSACGLGDAYTAKTTFSGAEFFGLYTEDDLDQARGEAAGPEEDFNEY
jgi:hypothetical protein